MKNQSGMSNLKQCRSRLDDLAFRIAQLEKGTKDVALNELQQERLNTAKILFGEANNLLEQLGSEELTHLELNAFYEAIISCDVELDYLLKPDVDPNIGWVEYQEHYAGDPNRIAVDTQLARAIISRNTGTILEYDDKPRKLNIIPLSESSPSEPCVAPLAVRFVEETDLTSGRFLNSSELPTCELTVPRSTLDLVTIRTKRKHLGPNRFAANTVLDLSFRAGVGAYLSNSTTGFSVEYWIEANSVPSNILAVFECALVLPSRDGLIAQLFPLSSVGGVSKTHLPAVTPALLTVGDVEGGIHGVRLLDGIDGYLCDIRSAKQLNWLRLAPILNSTTREYLGTTIQCAIRADKLIGDERANTIFISIM